MDNQHITVVIERDTDPTRPNEIELFIHCKRCLNERPVSVSPREWTQLDVGFHEDDATLQVWCRRHECNVGIMRLSLKPIH